MSAGRGKAVGHVACLCLALVLLVDGSAGARLEAERMRPLGERGRVVADSNALGGRVLRLQRGGSASRQFSLPATSSIRLRASRGPRCTRDPMLRLLVDGRRIAEVRIASRRWRNYGARIRVRRGRHAVRLVNIPPERRSPCYPAVRVDTVRFLPPRRLKRRPPVKLGTALSWPRIGSRPELRRLFLREFDSLTAENEMKMMFVQPERGVFDFRDSDALVGFGRTNGKEIRGHTLVWSDQLPGWLTMPLLPWTRGQLVQILRNHVQTVVGHFRGRVAEWDVVNEPLAEDGSYRRSIWLDTIGPEYIELALRWAHEADPDARLFLNEIAAEGLHAKSDGLLRRVTSLRNRGVPLHGVGFERHTFVGDGTTESQIVRNLKRFAATGVKLRFTEMDVATTSGAAESAIQARLFAETASACRRVRACIGFSTWGLADELSWLGAARAPLLFDNALRAKAAYYAVVENLPDG
jgi:endo-1,4-beta-xylanase